MAQPSGEDAGIPITVRYFAAARAAAGAESETVTVRPGSTVAELVDGLAGRDTRLATVLSRCSYLCDGIAVPAGAATSRPLRAGETIDVLPPFAGG
ncbi:MoaD/ThiS family protein [Mycobacterium fragae]|uniref:Molybdopterin synthase sulfur carrier subunit n=1 Tax=Mycobacterium fragae TaxID=1260918 RepID=A0A1X1V339_9MYCO|nr:MoaD/ThiS family protein [Mycobacterium fragae]MCV7399835.1 MoaD/ThiS family protein [Mycobacterium fragae]ORV63409.1 molybdopterin synthase sulfur carrier subunit [Mycobacterium fragae]